MAKKRFFEDEKGNIYAQTNVNLQYGLHELQVTIFNTWYNTPEFYGLEVPGKNQVVKEFQSLVISAGMSYLDYYDHESQSQHESEQVTEAAWNASRKLAERLFPELVIS